MAIERRRAPTFVERRMVDVAGAELVEIGVQSDGKAVWIKVDGRCRLRVTAAAAIEVEDARLPRGTSTEPCCDAGLEVGARGAPHRPGDAPPMSEVAARGDGADREPERRKKAPTAP